MALTALAGALRLLSLGDTPPGLYHDEAYNGLDALRVLEGEFPIYFAANHGREPLFLYLIAATVGVLGRSPGAVRLAAAICGTLTVPATYVMARAWFDRRTALVTAAIISTTLWHVHLSRVGFRAVMLPLTLACFLWSGARAFRSGRTRAWLLTGVLYGAAFYTYSAVRFTPVALLGLAVYLLFTDQIDRLWPGALYFGIGALLALMPMGAYALLHWDVVMGRPAQVSVLNPAVNQGDLWGTLGRHLIRTLAMFFVRGDSIARHNVPGRPVFTPLLGGAMILGTLRAAARARQQDAGSALVLIWVATMLVPTLAAADAPHFLRAVGVLPLLFVLPALGLQAIWDWAARQARRSWGSALLCLVLAFSLAATVRSYFFRYQVSSEAAYAFESAATELAVRINRFTGIGWDGQGIAASTHPPSREGRVYLDSRLWQAWKAVSFLVPEQQAVTRFQPSNIPCLRAAQPTLLVVWPYDDLQPYWASFPHPARVTVHAGPLTRGDLEEQAYPAYASYVIEPLAGQLPEPLAAFGQSIELVDLAVEREGHAWEVHLTWRARERPSEDYTAFVLVCDDRCAGEQLVAQDDAQPGKGYYPTHSWHPGDVVVDIRALELPRVEPVVPKIAVGLYAWPSMERLPVTESSSPSSQDMLVLSIGG